MKLRNILLSLTIMIIIVLTIPFGNFVVDEIRILLCVAVMILLFLISVSKVKLTNKNTPLLSDGRFYFLCFITLYSVWVPILSVIADITNTPFTSLRIYGAETYNVEEVLKTCYTSIFLLLGISIGFYIINIPKSLKYNHYSTVKPKFNKYKGWFWIASISTFVYLIPFFSGGFSAIRSGGSILDVEQLSSIVSGNTFLTVVGFFFSAELMTIGTSAFLMYYINSPKVSIRKKGIVSIIVILFHAFLAIVTTRSARFIIILVCLFAVALKNEEIRSHRLFKKVIRIIPFFVLMIYFIDYLIVNEVRDSFGNTGEGFIVEIMRRFDGVGPYDALFKAVQSTPNIEMLGNVPFSFLIGIPILGQMVTKFLGMDSIYSPLYTWMASEYPTIYQSGGGLAYMPQIEAYLTLGFFGCLIFGIIYGLIFGKRRDGLGNIIIIALGLMLARGSFGVIASLSIPYIILGYLFYEKFLLRLSIKK